MKPPVWTDEPPNPVLEWSVPEAFKRSKSSLKSFFHQFGLLPTSAICANVNSLLNKGVFCEQVRVDTNEVRDLSTWGGDGCSQLWVHVPDNTGDPGTLSCSAHTGNCAACSPHCVWFWFNVQTFETLTSEPFDELIGCKSDIAPHCREQKGYYKHSEAAE